MIFKAVYVCFVIIISGCFLLNTACYGEADIRVDIILSQTKIFNEETIKFLNNRDAKFFRHEMEAAQKNRINFRWDRRGYYIVCLTKDSVTGYECKPWMLGDKLILIPVEFTRLPKGEIKFNKYLIEKGFQAPVISQLSLEKLFPDLKQRNVETETKNRKENVEKKAND